MLKRTKILLILASVFLGVGTIIFGTTLALNNFDFKSLDGARFESKNYEFSEDLTDISILTSDADISFIYSDLDVCKVECYQKENTPYSAVVKDSKLEILEDNNKGIFDFINLFNFKKPTITIYLPKTEYLSLKITTDTGDINLPNNFNFTSVEIKGSTGDINFNSSCSNKVKISLSTGNINLFDCKVESLDLVVSTGDITANKLTCINDLTCIISTGEIDFENLTAKNLTITGSTSDVDFVGVVLTEKLKVTLSTGDFEFYKCDANTIEIKTNTGDVMGTLLTTKEFDAITNTGYKSLPSEQYGNKCFIRTSTGNINIKIA